MANFNAIGYSQFQSIQGPTDPSLRHSEIEGYQPVSRIGEVVINSFGAPPRLRILQIRLRHSHFRPCVYAQSTRTSLLNSPRR